MCGARTNKTNKTGDGEKNGSNTAIVVDDNECVNISDDVRATTVGPRDAPIGCVLFAR